MSVPARLTLVTLGVTDATRSTEFYEALGWQRSSASVPGEVTFLRVEDEALTVEPDHLLACEASLQPRFTSLGEGPGSDFLVLEGRGLVALSVAGRPLTLTVEPDLPVSVPAGSVITWNGALEASLVDDPQLREAMGSGASAGGAWLRFAGRGRVLVEQPRG